VTVIRLQFEDSRKLKEMKPWPDHFRLGVMNPAEVHPAALNQDVRRKYPHHEGVQQ